MTSKNFFRKLDNTLGTWERHALVFLLATLIFLAFLQIILRNIFNQGWIWSDLLTRQITLWLGFVGASLATFQNKHITIDLLVRFFGEKAKPVIAKFILLLIGGVCLLLTLASWIFLQLEKEGGTDLVANIPSWVFLIILPVSFSLMAFHALIKVFLGEE